MKSAGMTSTDDFSVRSVLYASDGYTTHDRRFLESAASDGRTVHFVRFDGGRRVLETRSLPDGVVEVDWLGATEPMTDGNRQNFGRAFRSVATSIRADVVHAGPVPTVGEVCATNSPVPVIVMSWASDLLIDACADGIVEAQARKALAAASHVLVDNQAIGVSAAALGADIDRLSVVPWGVDLCQFPMASLPNTGAGPLRLVSLRSLEPVYDIATLLRAISLVNRPVEVTIAGDGSMGSELRNLSEDLKLVRSITWAGRVPEPEVRNLLASHHVHVSTSRSRRCRPDARALLPTSRRTANGCLPNGRSPSGIRMPSLASSMGLMSPTLPPNAQHQGVWRRTGPTGVSTDRESSTCTTRSREPHAFAALAPGRIKVALNGGDPGRSMLFAIEGCTPFPAGRACLAHPNMVSCFCSASLQSSSVSMSCTWVPGRMIEPALGPIRVP